MKTPKCYFVDSGLACHLLGIESARALERSPFLGAVFEGFVASEIAKQQINRGGRPEVYYFRDHQGLEVDFLVPHKSDLVLIEAKASRTPVPQMADGLVRLRAAMKFNARHAAGRASDARDLTRLDRATAGSARRGIGSVARGARVRRICPRKRADSAAVKLRAMANYLVWLARVDDRMFVQMIWAAPTRARTAP